MKILLLVSLLFSSQAFSQGYVYKVEKGDNLSTILNSFGIYESKEKLYESVERHAESNKLKSKHLIYPEQDLKLSLGKEDKLFECNLEKSEDALKFKTKYMNAKDKESFLKYHNYCKKEKMMAQSPKPAPDKCEKKCKKKKNHFFLMSGQTDTKIRSGTVFRGRAKTEHRMAYDVEINIFENKDSNIYLLHGLEFESFKHSRVSNTQRMEERRIFKPEIGLQYRSNNETLNGSIAAVMETHLLARDIDADTLAMEKMYSPGLRLGFHLNPWMGSKLELFGSAVLGTTASVDSALTVNARFSQKLFCNFGLAVEAHHSDVEGGNINQSEQGIAGGITLDF